MAAFGIAVYSHLTPDDFQMTEQFSTTTSSPVCTNRDSVQLCIALAFGKTAIKERDDGAMIKEVMVRKLRAKPEDAFLNRIEAYKLCSEVNCGTLNSDFNSGASLNTKTGQISNTVTASKSPKTIDLWLTKTILETSSNSTSKKYKTSKKCELRDKESECGSSNNCKLPWVDSLEGPDLMADKAIRDECSLL